MDPIHTEIYKGYTINILHDKDCQNPREWDNLGTMLCIHSRYILGDDQNITLTGIHEVINDKNNIVLPLYLYDHSGITISTSPFSCPWDSGQVGIIYISLEDIRKEYSVKRVSAKLREKVINMLIAQVETYDDYLTGNCYGYQIENTDESCWGFLGDYDGYALQEARSMVDYLHTEAIKQANIEAMELWQFC